MARNSHANLHATLMEKERRAERISKAEILAATGWKPRSLVTYLTKGQLSDFLTEVTPGIFEITKVSTLSPEQFSKALSQSKHRRGLGHKCKSRLARALLQRSSENMLLALELYNRPSLTNRLDGFALLFCTAWEQLLKARLIENRGEASIFKLPAKRDRHRETISLRDCLDSLYEPDDPVRLNLERIKNFRDEATHLLMPELQPLVSRLFQSGVLNYSETFATFADQPFMSGASVGLMTIVGDFKEPSVMRLQAAYGTEIGREVFDLAKTIEAELEAQKDIKFAIPIDIKLMFARKGERGQWLPVSSADDGVEGLRKAVVIEKPVDRHRTHPFTTSEAIEQVNLGLREALAPYELDQRLPARDRQGHPIINGYCFSAIVHHLGWRTAGNTRYHYLNEKPEYHYYSDHAVAEIIRHIRAEPEFLRTARTAWKNHIASSKKAPGRKAH